MTRILRICLVLVALLSLSAPLSAQSSQKAPKLNLKDIRGRRIRLADCKGKVVLLNFWATWCPPCRAEIPDLIKLQRKYRAQGLRIIGVTYPPQTLAQVRGFVRKRRVNYPVAMGTKETKVIFDDGDVLPITVIIDRTGNIRDVIQGVLYPDEFARKVKPLLVKSKER